MGAEATDLLRRFSGTGGVEEAMKEVVGGVELNLGLSLGGFFCEEPREEEKLLRSASVAVQPDASMAGGPTIGRACSLPVEAEEGRRKRKEMQGLKRMEAKRRRSEKKDPGFAGNVKAGARKVVPVELPPSAMLQGLSRSLGAVSQGSIRSQGSSSSSLSELESRPAQGFENTGLGSCAAVKSAFTLPSLLNRTNCKATNSPTSAVGKPTETSNKENNLPKKSARANEMKDAEKIMLEVMPQVHVQGDGPNGKRVEGFLYNYKKGEVRIVCVCHGNFLTPAEFVKHAGGSDVTNPFRHIIVNTSQVAM